MDFLTIFAQLVGGAVGGTASGKFVKDFDLGSVGNIVTGSIGGLGGGAILGALVGGAGDDATTGLNIGTHIGQLAGGGVAGAVLQIVVGLMKNKFVSSR
ncbi:hypothetical protein [Ensifer sp. 4252]|uniref:hypothetical protein n=1 Tax=Ensifer sp. 4252 TaxID=3373915 RepID=UPI003D196C40